MHHFTAHAFPPDLLFHDWCEARQLWDSLLSLGPVQALVLMPDHVHLIARDLDPQAWWHALRGYARWRNHHRGEPGRRVWLALGPPEEVLGAKHLRRALRYLALNPCRDRLVADPLAWPFSTYRDSVGLAVPGVVAIERDPVAWHAYVSSDPSVSVEGTDLPSGLRGLRAASVEQVVEAVSALARTPVEDLRRRGPARTLLVQGLLGCAHLSGRAVARHLGLSHTAIQKAAPLPSGTHARIERVLGDRRFAALHTHDLSLEWAWRRYREGRERRGAYAALLERAPRSAPRP
ncbi:MAG: hypothetical protein ABIO70_20755 [Pseudomonadota bacterium]